VNRGLRSLLLPSIVLGILTACVGSDQTPAPPQPDGGVVVVVVLDGGGGIDAGHVCAVGCKDPSTLTNCDGTTTACPFECSTTDGPHCTEIHPSNPISSNLITTPGLKDTTITTTGFDTKTGAIGNLRQANAFPTQFEIDNGIGFLVVTLDGGNQMGIWSFQSLTIPAGETIHFTSDNAVGLVAQTTATIEGVIDVRPYGAGGAACPQVANGPSPGGPGAPLPGPGAGGNSNSVSTFAAPAPGGGAYGKAGGRGGAGSPAASRPGVSGGAEYGAIELKGLPGGSAGGSAKGPNGGGGGGGAIQLVAGIKVTIGNSKDMGGINAGGCGGGGGTGNGAPSGGGSGGAILIESPSIDIQPYSGLAANGGAGGGSGSNTTYGNPGGLAITPAAPGTTGAAYSMSGAGGAGDSCAGGNGADAAQGSGAGAGGAGGGSCGRIRINNRAASYTLTGNAFLSPSIASGLTTFGPASVY
jgi:hypothetical protein